MSQDAGPGFGGVLEGAPPGLADQRRQRRLARDAAGCLDEGEKLLAPAASGAQGGGIFVLAAFGALAVTMVTLVSLEFSPAVGRAPMKPYFLGPDTWAASCIDDALTTPAGGADAASWPGRAA